MHQNKFKKNYLFLLTLSYTISVLKQLLDFHISYNYGETEIIIYILPKIFH